MLGFGLDAIRTAGNQQRAAITVGKTKVSYDDYREERRRIENQYRQMLGPQYDQLSKQLNLNLPQQAFDRVVANELIGAEAERLGMVVGDNEVRRNIVQMLGGNFDRNQYEALLRQFSMSEAHFVEKLRADLIRSKYQQVLQDAALPVQREALGMAGDLETAFSVHYAEFKPEDFVAKVPAPSDETLAKFYEDNATDYERPANVSYNYVVLSPELFMDKVEVFPEDVEEYYSSHEEKYKTGPQLRVRHIQLNYGEGNDPKKMADLKTKADELHARLIAGEPFDLLAQQYSDDIKTKFLGGDLGWVSKGTMPKEFDQVAFAMAAPGIAEVASVDYGFHLIKVEEIKKEATKPLSEVRAEIETELRKREAPSYASAQASEYFAQ
jgi:peptidyl-prolyl cis-trans isomerase D